LDLRLYPVADLQGGLGSRVVAPKRMQREGDRLKPLSILALYAFPPRDFRVGGLDLTRGLVVGCALRIASLGPLEAGLGDLQFVEGPLDLPANRERITFHDVVHEVKHIWNTQAF